MRKLRCSHLQQLAVSGGNQGLTSGEQTFASLKRKLEGKCLWHFLEQWRYNYNALRQEKATYSPPYRNLAKLKFLFKLWQYSFDMLSEKINKKVAIKL